MSSLHELGHDYYLVEICVIRYQTRDRELRVVEFAGSRYVVCIELEFQPTPLSFVSPQHDRFVVGDDGLDDDGRGGQISTISRLAGGPCADFQ